MANSHQQMALQADPLRQEAPPARAPSAHLRQAAFPVHLCKRAAPPERLYQQVVSSTGLH